MNPLSNILLVYKEKRYLIITLLIMIFIILFVNLLPNFRLLKEAIFDDEIPFFKILYELINGVFTNNNFISLLTTALTGLLVGISISLIVFKYKSVKELKIKESGTVSVGAIAGLLSSGCSACSIGLLTSLGLMGGLATLPFKGYEVWSAGVFLLLISIFVTSKSISECKVCVVNTKRKSK